MAGLALIGLGLWQSMDVTPTRNVQAVVQVVTAEPLPSDAELVLTTTNAQGERRESRQNEGGQSGKLMLAAQAPLDTVQADIWLGVAAVAVWRTRPKIILAGKGLMLLDETVLTPVSLEGISVLWCGGLLVSLKWDGPNLVMDVDGRDHLLVPSTTTDAELRFVAAAPSPVALSIGFDGLARLEHTILGDAVPCKPDGLNRMVPLRASGEDWSPYVDTSGITYRDATYGPVAMRQTLLGAKNFEGEPLAFLVRAEDGPLNKATAGIADLDCKDAAARTLPPFTVTLRGPGDFDRTFCAGPALSNQDGEWKMTGLSAFTGDITVIFTVRGAYFSASGPCDMFTGRVDDVGTTRKVTLTSATSLGCGKRSRFDEKLAAMMDAGQTQKTTADDELALRVPKPGILASIIGSYSELLSERQGG